VRTETIASWAATVTGAMPPGNVWSIIVTAAGFMVAAVVGYFTVQHNRKNLARAEIRYSCTPPVPVQVHPGRFPGHRRVWSMEVVLENGYQLPITKDMFTGQPMVVDFEVPVLEVVSLASLPSEMKRPEMPTPDDTTIRIEPLVFCRGQVLRISVLTARRPEDIAIEAQMPDVRLIKARRPEAS
jgi:hypothetical protein